jgi:hypothetical protein
MTELERFLREMGLDKAPPPPPPVKRVWGVWHRDGDIPH